MKCDIVKGYNSCFKELMRHRRIIPDTVLKSLSSVLFDSVKILVIRTHPEELHGLENGLNCNFKLAHISTLEPRSSSG